MYQIVVNLKMDLSDYVETLEDQVHNGLSAVLSQAKKKVSFHEDKEKRVKNRNVVKKIKCEMNNLETKIDKLKAMASDKQIEIDNTDSSNSLSVLVELSDNMNKKKKKKDKKKHC